MIDISLQSEYYISERVTIQYLHSYVKGVICMAQAMVNFRMDEKLKKDMEKTCKDMGLTLTAAFTMFATKVTQEQRIPFEIVADPFYSKANIERLEKAIADVESGKSTLKEHELIEVDE